MTEEEFVAKWRVMMAGWGLYGSISEATGGPLQRASRACNIPADGEKFLRMMYRDLQPTKPEPKPAVVNGPAQPVKGKS